MILEYNYDRETNGGVGVLALFVLAIFCCPASPTQYPAISHAEQITFGSIAETEPNIWPDGRWIAFQFFAEGGSGLAQIWIMETTKGFGSARRLASQLVYAGEMGWSTDSKWISFISPGAKLDPRTDQIFKVDILLSRVIQVTHFPRGTLIGDSTTWSTNGCIAFERSGMVGCVPSDGGEEVSLLDAREILSGRRPSYLRFSPDSKMMLFSVENAEQDQSSIWLAELGIKSFRKLTWQHFDLFPNWIDNEHIVFVRQSDKKWSDVEVMSLLTGNVTRLTSMHVDITPTVDPSGTTLYWSRRSRILNEDRSAEFLAGFHVWRAAIVRRQR